MSLNKRVPPFDEKSFARDAGTYSIRFTAAGVTPCVGVVQDEGLVLAASGVTRTGAGIYVITLRERFMRINCSAPTVLLPSGGGVTIAASVVAKVEGLAAANTITIETWDIVAGALADPSATLELNFRVITSAGR